MFSHRRFGRKALFLAGAFAIVSTAAQAQSPNLGTQISPADAAAWDISVAPDGAGLPSGSGTAKQGKEVFAMKCAACHGEKGEGGEAAKLWGGNDTLKYPSVAVRTVGSYWPYATTAFDFIRRAMPWNAPKTLTDDEVYSTTAYVLYLNGIVAEDAVIDKNSLPKVKMPNRDNFTELYPTKK